MVNAVLFDLGNTLQRFSTLSMRRLVKAVVQRGYDRLLCEGHDLPTYEKYFRSLRWGFIKAAIRSALTKREIHLASSLNKRHRKMGIIQSEAETEAYLDDCLGGISTFVTTEDGAHETISKLHEAGIKMGLVSNTVIPGRVLDDYFEKEGLLRFFPVRVYSSEVTYKKPDPRIYKIALERMGTAPEQTAFVGDRLDNDVKGPGKLGMQTILFAPHGQARRLWTKPDHVVSRLLDIPQILLHPSNG